MAYRSKTFAPASSTGHINGQYLHEGSNLSSTSLSSISVVHPNPQNNNTSNKYSEMTSDFASKRWVWVPDSNIAFIMGFVTYDADQPTGEQYTSSDQLGNVPDIPEGHLQVRCVDDTDRVVPSHAVSPVNPPKFELASDMAELTHLNEPSVIHNLRARYMKDLIYTYSGLFLVAINPYKDLGIYGDDSINMYRASSRRKAQVLRTHLRLMPQGIFKAPLEKLALTFMPSLIRHFTTCWKNMKTNLF